MYMNFSPKYSKHSGSCYSTLITVITINIATQWLSVGFNHNPTSNKDYKFPDNRSIIKYTHFHLKYSVIHHCIEPLYISAKTADLPMLIQF